MYNYLKNQLQNIHPPQPEAAEIIIKHRFRAVAIILAKYKIFNLKLKTDRIISFKK